MICHRIAGQIAPIALMALLVLMGGCASTPPADLVNPALFARSAVLPESRTPGRVALLVPVQVQGTIYRSDKYDIIDLRLPIGRVVEQAMLAALGDGRRGGVQQVSAVPPPGSGFGATLVVDALRYEHHFKWLWIVPVPLPPFVVGQTEASSQLAFDVSLLDAEGQRVWTRTYDAGSEIWKPTNAELPSSALVRLAHEEAWRLAQQAMHDLADWLNAERIKPREL